MLQNILNIFSFPVLCKA